MPAYQSGGNNIGELLRLIQEEKSSQVLANPPASEVGSPIRDLNQQPLLAPEQAGGNRQVSLRPEGIAPADPTQVAPEVVAPIAPTQGASAFPAPIGNPAPQGQPSAPAYQAPQENRPASPSVASPRIGTFIKANSSQPSANPAGVAAFQSTGSRTSRTSNIPSTSKLGGLGAFGGLVEKKGATSLATKLLPKLGGTVAGGFSLANAVLEKLTGGSWAKPRKVY